MSPDRWVETTGRSSKHRFGVVILLVFGGMAIGLYVGWQLGLWSVPWPASRAKKHRSQEDGLGLQLDAGQVLEFEHPPVFEEVKTIGHAFQITNPFETEVNIEAITNSCGCTSAKVDSPRLQPGEGTMCRLEVNLQGREGRQRFSCTVSGNGGTAVWRCDLLTTVWQHLRAEPNAVHFGIINPNCQVREQLNIVCRGETKALTPTILSVRPLTSSITVEQTAEENVSENERRHVFAVKLSPQTPPGPGSSELRVEYSLGTKAAEAQVLVDWNVRTLYEINPPRIFFGSLDALNEKDCERVIHIQRSDNKPFAVHGIESSLEGVTCSLRDSSRSRNEHQVVLNLNAAKIKDSFKGMLIVRTDVQVQPVITIPMAGIRLHR